jgi:hypothetical protein
MKNDTYRNGKIPGRRGYGIDDTELARLFGSGLEILGIADKMGISQWTVLAHLKKLGLRRTQRHPITKQDAFVLATADTCYWGGFLAADGFVLSGRNGIGTELSVVDVEHLQALCHFVGRDDILMFRRKYQKDKVFEYARLDIHSARIMDDLARNFGIVPRKSLIIQPPVLPCALRRHFIRGYFDGDGSIGWHKYNRTVRLCFMSGSEPFLAWVRDTIREETAVASAMTISKRKRSQTRVFELYGDEAIRVMEWMYGDGGHTRCLERKRRKFESYCARRGHLVAYGD